MRLSRPMQYAVSAAALSIFFAGSAAWGSPVSSRGPLGPMLRGGPGSAPAAGRGFMKFAKGAQIVYIASFDGNFINVYAQAAAGNSPPIGKLTGSNGLLYPNNIYVSPTGDLYVTSYYGYLMAYHEATLQPYMTWYDGTGASTYGVTTVGKRVYATQRATSVINEYVPGTVNPIGTLHETNITKLFSIASDSKGDLFVDGLDASSNFLVDEFPAGSQTPKILQNLGNSGAYPGGLAVDIKGDLLVGNLEYDYLYYGDSNAIYTYAPPWNGSPVATATLSGWLPQFALSQDGQSLWVTQNNADGYFGYYYCEWFGEQASLGGSALKYTYYMDGCSDSLFGAATSPHNRIGP